MIVRLTREAERDLEAIADRIAKDNPERALSFVQELRESCLGLADFPERFPLVPRYERAGVRHRVHGNYLILHRVEAEAVTVLHLLLGATDYGEALFPDG
jgi:plasmid stabilization system protein ParE